MWPMSVVAMEPMDQLSGALIGVVVGTRVSPFAQRGLDEALGLAIGLGRVSARPRTSSGPSLSYQHVVASASSCLAAGFHRAVPANFGAQAAERTGLVAPIKHDGFRLLAYRDGDRVRLFTRRGLDWAERYPGITKGVAALKADCCFIDGEVVVCDEAGRPSFEMLRSRRPE